MNNPFGGGYSIATIIHPEQDRVRVLFGAVPYQHDITLGKVYKWEFASIRDGGATLFPTIAEMAQIARFLDNGGGVGISRQHGAMAQLKSYVYLAALANKFAAVEMAEAA